VDRAIDLPLRLEDAVERGERNPGLRGNTLDLGRLVSLLAEHSLGRIEDGLTIEVTLPIPQ